jgi:hypothetical protein
MMVPPRSPIRSPSRLPLGIRKHPKQRAGTASNSKLLISDDSIYDDVRKQLGIVCEAKRAKARRYNLHKQLFDKTISHLKEKWNANINNIFENVCKNKENPSLFKKGMPIKAQIKMPTLNREGLKMKRYNERFCNFVENLSVDNPTTVHLVNFFLLGDKITV